MEMEIGHILDKEAVFSFDAGHLGGENHRKAFRSIFEVILKFTKELIKNDNPVELRSKTNISSPLLNLSTKDKKGYQYEIANIKFWNSLPDIAYHIYDSNNNEIHIILHNKFTLIITVLMDPIYFAIKRE